jgi:hypothetical protein
MCIRWFITAAVLGILPTGCAPHKQSAPAISSCNASTPKIISGYSITQPARAVSSLNANGVPKQFSFITTQTTLRQVVDRLGEYSRVRGSGISYYEYDLPDGSAVLVGPEWPFDDESKIQNVTFYLRASEIGLAP